MTCYRFLHDPVLLSVMVVCQECLPAFLVKRHVFDDTHGKQIKGHHGSPPKPSTVCSLCLMFAGGAALFCS